jgi:glycosyltransferase involved in cell wall biosynthesis
LNKRILFVDHDENRTGSTISLEYLIKGFRDRGYEISVLTPKTTAYAQPYLAAGARIIHFRQFSFFPLSLYTHFTNERSIYSPEGILTFLHDIVALLWGTIIASVAIWRVRPHLVYVNEHVFLQASIASRLANVPSVIQLRSQLLRGRWGIRRRILSWMILNANQAVIAITRLEGDQLCADEKRQKKVKVIGEFSPSAFPFPVDTMSYRSQFSIPTDKQMITFMGGIAEIKGTMIFLEAALKALEYIPNAVFAIAGNLDRNNDNRMGYFEKCMRMLRELQQREAIYLIGEISNPLDLIAASDVIVSSATASHFSRPVIEAWRLGKPVIASRTEHMLELIEEGTTGLLYSPFDADMLSERLIRLLSDHLLLKTLQTEGRKRALVSFDADTNVRAIVDLCDSIPTR